MYKSSHPFKPTNHPDIAQAPFALPEHFSLLSAHPGLDHNSLIQAFNGTVYKPIEISLKQGTEGKALMVPHNGTHFEQGQLKDIAFKLNHESILHSSNLANKISYRDGKEQKGQGIEWGMHMEDNYTQMPEGHCFRLKTDSPMEKSEKKTRKPRHIGKQEGVIIVHALEPEHKKLIGIHTTPNPTDQEFDDSIAQAKKEKKSHVIIHGAPPERLSTRLHPDKGVISPGLNKAELEKGSRQAKMPFKETGHGEMSAWVNKGKKSWSHDPADGHLRDKIPEITPEGRERLAQRLHSQTAVKKDPTTGERMFLLHRGTSSAEIDASHNGTSVNHEKSSSWTPDLNVAAQFSRQGSDRVNNALKAGNTRQANVMSAWVKESAIHHAPMMTKTMSGEKEIIVKPNHNSIAATEDEQKAHANWNPIAASQMSQTPSKQHIRQAQHNKIIRESSSFIRNQSMNKSELNKAFLHADGTTSTDQNAHTNAWNSLPDFLKHWGIHNLSTMKNDTVAEHQLNIHKIVTRKHENDLFSGHVISDGKQTHTFDHLTLPLLLSQLQSKLEMYAQSAPQPIEEPKPELTPEQVNELESRLRTMQAEIKQKFMPAEVSSLEIPAAAMSNEPEAECPACERSSASCVCYTGMSRPDITIDYKNKRVLILFKSDWDSETKSAFEQDVKARGIKLLRKIVK